MRTLFSLLTVLALLGPAACPATEIYWSPAHELAPQGMSGPIASGDLDGDSDMDVSMIRAIPAHHFWNIGTPQIPAWELDTTVYVNVPWCSRRSGALGDVDADGDLDLVFSCWDDTLRFYWNAGTPEVPLWEADQSVVSELVILGGGADPSLADIDGDGDLDLLVAMSFGIVKRFDNVGTAMAPVWEHVGYLEGVSIGPGGTEMAAFGDIDGDGDLDLVAITWDTPIQCWENVGTQAVPQFVENPSMLIGVTDPGEDGGHGIELLDIDADGDPDLLVSDRLGVNYLYLNEQFVPVQPTTWGQVKALYR
jgi:hypothetical protein